MTNRFLNYFKKFDDFPPGNISRNFVFLYKEYQLELTFYQSNEHHKYQME